MGSKMEVSEAEIQKVYHRDCILLAGFAIFMWCILSTILRQALQVAGDSTYKNNYDLYCVGDWKCIVPRTFCSLQTLKKKQRCDL